MARCDFKRSDGTPITGEDVEMVAFALLDQGLSEEKVAEELELDIEVLRAMQERLDHYEAPH